MFFFNDTATTEIYTLSLHDALPIYRAAALRGSLSMHQQGMQPTDGDVMQKRLAAIAARLDEMRAEDRKSTRLNSSHANISYAVFCLKKKMNISVATLLSLS